MGNFPVLLLSVYPSRMSTSSQAMNVHLGGACSALMPVWYHVVVMGGTGGGSEALLSVYVVTSIVNDLIPL